MIRRAFLLLLATTLWAAPWADPCFAETAGATLVFVAAAASPLEHLSPEEARKLYLGVPLLANGQAVRPLDNHADAICREAFLQKVLFMSAEAYERQTLNRIFRSGGARPTAYAATDELVSALRAEPLAVSYMPRAVAAAAAGLKIVGMP